MIATIIGSSGITIISHDCHSCHQVSYTTESVFSNHSAEDDCCSDAHTSNPFNQQGMISNGVCEHKIEQFKIENLVTEKQVNSSLIIDRPVVLKVISATESPDILLTPVAYSNKYGGRSIINSTCQFIS